MTAATVDEMRDAAEMMGGQLEAARHDLAVAQKAADAAAAAHDSLIERAYGGDDSIPWGQVKRAERDMAASKAALDQARAAVDDAERADTKLRRDLAIEEFTVELTTGPTGSALTSAWSRVVGYTASLGSMVGVLVKVPRGRLFGENASSWQLQQSLNRSHGVLDHADAVAAINDAQSAANAALGARREFRRAAATYNTKLDEAIAVLRGFGLTEWLISDGRGGYRHGDRTVVRCDLHGAEVYRWDESLESLCRSIDEARARMQDAKPPAQMKPGDDLPRMRRQAEAKASGTAPGFPNALAS